MKKLMLFLALIISLIFGGCQNNDQEYIKNIKAISFGGEKIYFAENVEDLAKNICITWQFFSPVDKRDLKWSIEKTNKEEKTKIVKCEHRGNKIFFVTYYGDEYRVDLVRSYTVSKMGWENSMIEIIRSAHPVLQQYFE